MHQPSCSRCSLIGIATWGTERGNNMSLISTVSQQQLTNRSIFLYVMAALFALVWTRSFKCGKMLARHHEETVQRLLSVQAFTLSSALLHGIVTQLPVYIRTAWPKTRQWNFLRQHCIDTAFVTARTECRGPQFMRLHPSQNRKEAARMGLSWHRMLRLFGASARGFIDEDNLRCTEAPSFCSDLQICRQSLALPPLLEK